MEGIKRIDTSNAGFKIDTEQRTFGGYGIVFDSNSVPFRSNINGKDVEVYEQIRSQSLENADFSDVIVSFNHNLEKILGRTAAGTATIEKDEKGVRYLVPDLPETTAGNDLIISSKRGDIQGSSFWFQINWEKGFDFEQRADGNYNAYPVEITKVIEMGPVVSPAYPETSAQLRDAFKAHFEQKEIEIDNREEQKNLKNAIAIRTIV